MAGLGDVEGIATIAKGLEMVALAELDAAATAQDIQDIKCEARLAASASVRPASCERTSRSGRAHARSFRLNHHCRRELTPLSSTPRLICASTSAERRDRRVGSTGVSFLTLIYVFAC